MSILDNELVRKYFPCDRAHRDHGDTYILCGDVMAGKILTAMQEPIRKGERYLNTWFGKIEGESEERTSEKEISGFHPFSLRLPDKFQKRECQPHIVKCAQCGFDATIHMPKQGDTVTFNLKPKPQAEKCEVGYDCKNECDGDPSGCYSRCHHKPKGAVEEKIAGFVGRWAAYNAEQFHKELRELVELARKNA